MNESSTKLQDTISVLQVVHDTMVDGPGMRTTVYCAGCPNHCPGCHNPESWDIQHGTPVSVATLLDELLADPFADVTFSGGDPMFRPKPSHAWPMACASAAARPSGAIRVSPSSRSSPIPASVPSSKGSMCWSMDPSSLHSVIQTWSSEAARTSVSSTYPPRCAVARW